MNIFQIFTIWCWQSKFAWQRQPSDDPFKCKRITGKNWISDELAVAPEYLRTMPHIHFDLQLDETAPHAYSLEVWINGFALSSVHYMCMWLKRFLPIQHFAHIKRDANRSLQSPFPHAGRMWRGVSEVAREEYLHVKPCANCVNDSTPSRRGIIA